MTGIADAVEAVFACQILDGRDAEGFHPESLRQIMTRPRPFFIVPDVLSLRDNPADFSFSVCSS